MSDWKPKRTSDSVNLVGGDATMFKLILLEISQHFFNQVCSFSLIKGDEVPSKKFLQGFTALKILVRQLSVKQHCMNSLAEILSMGSWADSCIALSPVCNTEQRLYKQFLF